MRCAVVLVTCLSLSCGHGKAAGVIAGTTTLGAIGVGLPLAHECTPGPVADCGVVHDGTYVGLGAIAGAILGIWIYRQWSDGERDDHAKPPATTSWPVLEPHPPPPSPPPPAVAPLRDLVFPLAGAGAIDDLPGSTLGAEVVGTGVAATCIEAKRQLADELEARCEHQGLTHGLDRHTLLDEPCLCDHRKSADLCDTLGDATCAELDAPFHTLGFADTEARAEDHAQFACWAGGRIPGAATVRCVCSTDVGAADDTCGCVADVECAQPAP